MEGLIPFVYRAVMQYKNGNEGPLGSWLNDSPSACYTRLPTGESGRFQTADIQLIGSDYGFSANTAAASSGTTEILVSKASQSPLCRLTHRHIVA